MNASDACKAFIKSFETCRLRAYPDPTSGAEPWTCGWGSTHGVGPDTVWTQAQADLAFEADIAASETLVRHFVTHPTTQGQFDAFVSIFQNVGPGKVGEKSGIAFLRTGGPSTLLRAFNDGDIAKCEQQWTLWISPGSSSERGLLRRRKGELEMFRRPDEDEGERRVA